MAIRRRFASLADNAPPDSAMPELTFDLNLSAAKVLTYYRGETRVVQVRATNGQLVQFPASALQRLVTADGVHGRFKLVFDENRKFVGLERLGDAGPAGPTG